ncbi:MAG TPA: methyl-accepting chemotaxis protein [Spirochaetia bacterium]|nr:methyl-accepting chemotaxis protein [Spirochaetia bacterium]
MKISGKLNAALFSVIIGFAAAAGFLLYSASISIRLSSLSLIASQVIGNMYGLNSATQNIMTTSGTLQDADKLYGDALKAFQDSFAELQHHPALSLLNDTLRKDVVSAGKVWTLVQPSFEEVSPSIGRILQANASQVGTKTGILRMELNAQNEKYSFGAIAMDIISLESVADSAQSAGANFIVNILGGLSTKIEDQNQTVTRRSMTVAIGASLLVVIFSILFMLSFSRNLSRRVRSIETVMGKIAARDMTVRMNDHSRDEIGTLAVHINGMLDMLQTFLSTVRGATEKVDELKDTISSGSTESAAALNQITKNIESMKDQFIRLDKNVATTTDAIMNIGSQISELTTDISKQASFINSTSSSIEQMNASVQSVAHLSTERKRRADELTDVIRQGGEKIGLTNDNIRSVDREIGDILEIIEIINNVSEQTNLLSMNAAIESAHAGEAGKGFAVVAEEIRKLAESTSENAARIDQSLKSITSKIKDALQSSDVSYRSFENINQDVHDFANAMNEISSNMNELSAGSQEILQATSEIAEITQSITNRSGTMDKGAHEIQDAMQNVRNISAGVVGGMDEVDHGVKEILESLVDISGKTGESRERMEALNEILNSFTVEEDTEEPRPAGTDVVEWTEEVVSTPQLP